MRNRSVMFALAVLAAAGGVARAQEVQPPSVNNTAYGTTAAEFLTFAPNARGSALGNAFAALSTDISALFYNPAGLSQMASPEFQVSTTSYVASTRYSWVGIAFPFGGGARAVGISVGNFGFSDQPVYTVEDENGTSGLTYSVSETYIGLTLSQQFSDRFSAGFTGKFVNDKLGGVTGSAFAVDFGTSFHATIGGRPIRASFTVQNLGTTLNHTGNILNADVIRPTPQGQVGIPQEPANGVLKTKDWQLPASFRVALSYDVFTTAMSRLSLLGQFTQPNNNEPTFGFAGEYDVKLGTSGFSLAPRVSWTYQPANSLNPAGPNDPNYAGFATGVSNGMDGFAAGAGLRWRKNPTSVGFGFDYAYRNMGLLGNINTMSVGITW